MKILLVSATTFEIKPFIATLGDPQIVNENLNRYQRLNHQIDVLITGVGMVFTTFHLSAQLAKEQYDFAINAGVAGAIDDKLQLGEVVHVIQDYFYEFGAEDGENWLSIAALGLLSNHDLPYTESGLINQNVPSSSAIKALKQVKAHTVNKVHGNESSIKTMKQRSQAQIESMEGAAFLFCCLKMQVPCVQIRAISNYVTIRNKATWQMQKAVVNLNKVLKESLFF